MSRPLASLSSGLLARPGGAKPAMRPQAFGYPIADDLGWNDMGTAPPPAPAGPLPPVLTERAALAQAVALPAPQPAPPVDRADARRTAFTLRLDRDRHLRLRLAGAISGRSAQAIVIAALDAFLDAQPQVEARVPKLPTTDLSGTKR